MRKNKIKVGLVAEDRIAELHYLAYRERKDSLIYGAYSSDKKFIENWACKKYNNYSDLINDREIEAVEIVANPALNYQLAVEALTRNKNISLEYPPVENFQQLEELTRIAKSKNLRIYFYAPFLFYSPYLEAKKLLKEGKIGEIQALRIKSNIGKMDIFNREDIIFKEIYEKIFIALFFLGDIEKIFSLGIQSDKNFSPAIIIWKYKEPRRYGIFELVFSKEMNISSKYFPEVENIEITGTAGYIWITSKKANMQNIPSLILYRKDKLYSYQNLKDDWQEAFSDCTSDFISYLQRGKSFQNSPDKVRKILELVFKIFTN